MKSKEEFDALKNGVEMMDNKISELTENELKPVVGGVILKGQQGTIPIITCDGCSKNIVGSDWVFRNDDNKKYLITSLDDTADRSTYWFSQTGNPQIFFAVTVTEGNNYVPYLRGK